MKSIYVITNLVNNKRYIGQSYCPMNRKYQHFKEGRKTGNEHPLYRSMRKHGIENFTFEVIEECLTDQITDEREIYWISHYDSTHPDRGYNLDRGGRGSTKENRRSISEALKGNKHCVGRQVSEETKEKHRQSALKRYENKPTKIDNCMHCGLPFEVPSTRRKTCSNTCARSLRYSNETHRKISQSLASKPFLRDQIREEAISRLKAGQYATQVANDLDVSYKTVCRIRREICMN